MNKKQLRKKLALMLSTLKKKRPYYVECEYLESTGTQYIDTGYIPNTNTYVEMYAMYTSLDSTYRTPFSVRTSDGAANSFTISGATNTSNVYAFGSGYWAEANGCPDASTNVKYFLSLKAREANFNGVTGNAGKTITPSSLTAYMFARNANGTASNFLKGRIYYCQIYDNNTLIRDFIPVLDWNMTPCMYDRVTEQLFYNQGTGDFIAGREIHPVEYLESTGEQYIDTGFKPNNTSGIYAKIQYTNTTSADYVAVGTWLSNNRFVAPFRGASNGSWFSGWGASEPSSGVTGDALDTDIHEIFLNYNNSRSISVDNTSLRTDISSISGNWKPIYLFARNLDGVLSGQMVGRIYNVQITEGTVLVRDYIPAIDSSGTPFMFDRVSHTCFLNAGQGKFKYPAREVEYLKSDGVSLMYINPDIAYFPDFEVGVKCDANTDRNATLGTDANNMFERLSANQPYWTLHASGTVFMSSVGVSTYVDAKYKDGVFSSNGNTVGTKANTFPRGTFYLFRAPTNENAYKMSVYFFKAWDNNGVLVRDFIPCYKDGVLGMWDKANNVFYPNSGTGTFTTSKIIEPEYE